MPQGYRCQLGRFDIIENTFKAARQEGMMMIIGGTRSFRYMSKDKESSKIGINEILSDNAHGNAKIRDLD